MDNLSKKPSAQKTARMLRSRSISTTLAHDVATFANIAAAAREDPIEEDNNILKKSPQQEGGDEKKKRH